ncbi:MAG: gamma-glutamylcyclotransferase [Rhodospirillum sp.]|nr:gamma-glutamylcyclotransferase [Rhodospirillum sp.]MCF8491878.1 gamma-glutamylcyclotransferase [Rhodospirillum sp.]MCF8502274.1 gamma-glutamylcyclotransferase [Rhodospirillum sp.]
MEKDRQSENAQDFWVFGYGSLMWRPGFPHEETQSALLRGYHRSMCILSIRYRGTPEQPGLVLGLEEGGECMGRAYRVAPENIEYAVAYLRERELVTGVYLERTLPVTLEDGRTVETYGFVADKEHIQYKGALTDREAADIIQAGHGLEGPARDYLANTVGHLEALGIIDVDLARLLAVVDEGR